MMKKLTNAKLNNYFQTEFLSERLAFGERALTLLKPMSYTAVTN